MTQNKVNWGLALSAWGKVTTDTDGNDVYGVPNRFTGNRQVNFDAVGDMVKVFGDGTIIYTGKNNSGYTGTMELTSMDDEFAKWVLSEEVDSNNVQYEIKEPEIHRFFLLWEWVQDTKNTRHAMYNMTASRPSMSATTAGDGDTKTAQYRTLNLTAIPRADGIVKASTRADVVSTTYDNWFSSAYVPSATTRYALTVTVTDGTSAEAGVKVLLSSGEQAITNAAGQAVFNLAAGKYDVMASKANFTGDFDTVTITSGAATLAMVVTAII